MDHLAAWRRFRHLTYADIPADVRTVAEQCVLDWLGCALAGSREPLSELLRAEFGHRVGAATVLGSALRVDAATAALLNGSAGHALDYDDTSAAVGCHSTAPVLPAVLALAEELGASGEQLLAAFVVGVEIEGRVGNAFGPGHYARGWHTTSTFGVFGAAAGCAHLLGLDDTQYGRAIGLAASQAAGLKANFGTMTKPYHAGHAAEQGLIAARLAARGFTANPDALAGNQGLIQAAADGRPNTAKLAHIADRWLIRDTLFKYHAACYLTHAAIEAAFELRDAVPPRELASATITVHPGLLDICGIMEPATGLEGKFSLVATTAMAWLGIDTSAPENFVDAVVNRPDVRSLLRRIRVETDERLGQMQARVRCVDRRQAAYDAFRDTGIPAHDLARQGERLDAKFRALATPVLGARTQALREQIERLPRSALGAIVEPMTVRSSG
jgi:2-methylcitrate dehydratase PrpD